jgi:DNA invertase Pin-like site-specific DNA recombinase
MREADMIAAIYSRKSTEQTGADAEATSVARQIESARLFAASKGWIVPDEYIFADDAVSGADLKRLVNRQRLLDTIAAGPPFDVLLLRDQSRLAA